MNIVTVIPARGGSKSIPYKNIRLIGGKPLLAYSIEYSKKCPLISHTVVSTDSEKIAVAATEYGAELPFMRPSEIAGDHVQDYPVIAHALEQIELHYQEHVDAIAWLRPTSPLRPAGLIERAVEILESNPTVSSIRSVVESTEHPYRQWFLSEGRLKTASSLAPPAEPYNVPRQQLPHAYFQSGDIEVVRRETILTGSMSGTEIAPIFLAQDEMLDIDHFEDLKNAELHLSNGN